MAYRVVAHIDVSGGLTGMMIPIFSSDKTNIPYVQQMGEFLDVIDFEPFFDYELYPLVMDARGLTAIEGALGVVSFRSFDKEVICDYVDVITKYIDENIDEIRKFPVLHMQLQRIQGAELTDAYPVWESAARQLFESTKQRRDWLSSEHHFFQLQRTIWVELDKLEVAPETPAAFSGSLNDYAPEALFAWLSRRSNYLNRDWQRIWRNVVERLAFDGRVIDVAEDWLYSVYPEFNDLESVKSVLFVVLQKFRMTEHDKQRLGDFLSDAFDPEFYSIYSFLRPKSFFESILFSLSTDREVESSIRLLEFCSAELPRDPDLLMIVENAAIRLIRHVDDHEQSKRLNAVRDTAFIVRSS